MTTTNADVYAPKFLIIPCISGASMTQASVPPGTVILSGNKMYFLDPTLGWHLVTSA